MAEDFAIGRALVIPKDVLSNLDKVDEKINKIATDSENMATKFTAAMSKMSGSTDDLIKKLQSIQGLVGSIGNINIKGLDTASTSMGKTATEAERVANNVTQAATAINKMGSGMNIAELTSNIKELNKQLTSGGGVQSMSEQQQVVNKLRELQAELVVQKKSENQIDEENLKNAQRKQANLDKLVESYEKINKVNSSKQSKEEQDLANWVLSKKKEQAALEEQTAKTSEKYQKAEQERVENIFKIESEKRELQRKSYEEALKYADKLDKKEEEYRKKKQAALEKEVSRYEKQQMSSSRVPYSATEKQTLSWIEAQKKKEIEVQNELERISQEYAAKEQARVEEIARIEDERRKAKKASYEESLKYAQELDKKEEAAAKKRLDEINKEYQAQAKLDSQLRKSNYQSYVTSTEGSLRTADKANTYAQRAQAIKNLEEAIKKLRTTDANYQKDLQRLSEAHKRLSNEQKKVESNFKSIQSSQRNLMDTSGQLARQLALVFSVSQIEGYISKLVRVRGEFELQNTALASILQNKDQADKLFGQITDLAVKSPFTVKELTTYTKSLAAYQVQYEDLYDTTKMLADVSAGLGVDMQRLILAFGQVKAANFLRGTETRQFTEAGINMLGELAKYYTELEGRIVSVSEVQDRQFKKMISFQDVEQVFKRLTSAGGMFYEMQERQAETIAGQMSNLQDTIDIMLNDIGKANDGTIRLMISTIKSIIENWEIFANAIKTAGVVFTLYYAKVMLASVANGAFTKSTIAATVAQGGLVGATGKAITAIKALSTAIKSNPFLAVASAVTLLGYELYDHVKKVEENRKAYDVFTNSVKKVETEFNNISQRINEQNQKIKESSDTLSSFEKGTNEYVDAENNANKQREKMGSLLEELNTKFPEVYENIVQQKDGTVDLTEAQRLLNEELEKTTYLSYLSRQTETFWNDGLVENIKDASDAQQQYKIASEDLSNAYLQMNSRIKEYFATNKYASKDLQKQLEDIANSSISTSEKIEKMYSVVRNVSGVNIGDLRRIIYDYQDEASAASDANKELKESNRDLSESIKQVANGYKLAFDTTSEEGRKSAKEATEEFIRLLDIKNETVREFVRSQFEITIGVKLNIDNKATPELSDMEKRINNYLDNMNFTLVPKIDAGEGTVKFFNELKEEYKSLTEEAEKIKRASQELYPDQTNAQRLEEINNKMVQVKTTLEDWGELEEKKNKTTKDNSAIKRLNEQISLIKKAGDEYEKLKKYYSEEEAAAKVREAFADSFTNLGLDITMDFDTTGIIKGIENISHKAGQAGKKAIDNAVAPLKSQQDIDVKVKGIEEIQKEIDSIFTNYEFTLELRNAGIDADAFKNMLKSIGATDEEISLAGLDTTTFEKAQKEIRAKIEELSKEGGQQQLDTAKKYQEQLTQLEVKEAQKRFDELLTLREKYQTNEEKISKIETDISSWQKELDAIKSLGDSSNKEMEELLEMRIQNGNDTILKLKSEALQLTEFWRTLFGDLEDLSVSSLRKLSDTVDEIIGSSKEIKGDKGQIVGYSSEYTDKNGIKKQVTLTVEQYQRLLKQNNQVTDEIEEKNPFIALFDTITKGKGEGESTLDYITRIEGNLKTVSDAAFQVANDLADIFNADEDAKELLKDIKGIVDGTMELGTGVARIASGDVIGGTMSAISGIASIVTSIRNIHDNKKEREIERQLDLVEDLQYAYEKLEKAIDDAYSIDTYKKANDQAVANLKSQNASLRAAIAAEEDKKKTDDDRIKEWQQQIEDNNEAIEELIKEQFSQVTGGVLDDLLSAAEEFTDAWLESFSEVGDGMTGLEENFQEMLETMLKRQASMLITSSFLDNWKKQLEQYINADDLKLTADEAKNWVDSVQSSLPALNEALENYFNAMKDAGFDLTGDEGDTMSSLQRGIEGITAEQSDALESLLNSVRFFTSDSNAVLHNIYNAITIPNVENPFLMELKVQSEQLRLLYGLFNGIIKNVSGSGRAMNVRIV